MQKITVAAASVRNLIGQADTAIQNMGKWVMPEGEKGAELILFPELNFSPGDAAKRFLAIRLAPSR